MANAGITYNILIERFSQGGPKKTEELLQHIVNGKPTVIKTKKILDIISNHLNSNK